MGRTMGLQQVTKLSAVASLLAVALAAAPAAAVVSRDTHVQQLQAGWLLAGGGSGGANDTAVVRVLTTYAVSHHDPRPYLFAEFVAKMKQVEQEAEAQRGFRANTFSLAATDNEGYVGFWEWDSYDLLMSYFMKGDTLLRDMKIYLDLKDIRYRYSFLLDPKSKHHAAVGDKVRQERRRLLGDVQQPRPAAAHLVAYFPPPSVQVHLTKRFDYVMDNVNLEKGIKRYGLWQLSASNAEMVAYSEFDGDAALAGHLNQTYMRNLAGFLQENDIPWKSRVLVPIHSLKPWQG